MLMLQRNLTPGEVRTCKLSGKMIVYGDFYYQDTENPNYYVKATEYNKLKKENRERSFDYSRLENAETQAEYQQYLIEAQMEFLNQNILNQEIIHNGQIQNDKLVR